MGNNMKIIKLIALTLTLSLGFSANSKEVKDEFTIILPPEPDEILNATTIHGIDANKNGVRDDIEHYIYKNISKDWNVFNAYLQYYKNEHLLVKNFNDRQKINYYAGEMSWKAMNCIGYFDSNIKMTGSQLIYVFYNTPSRKIVLNEISNKMEGFGRKLKDKTEKIFDCEFKVKK